MDISDKVGTEEAPCAAYLPPRQYPPACKTQDRLGGDSKEVSRLLCGQHLINFWHLRSPAANSSSQHYKKNTAGRDSHDVRIDEEVHDVYRHGIVHGSVVNFDNVVVATKAWNLLYSVVDWAQATKKAAVPEEPEPTFTESLEQDSRNRRFRKHRNGFVPWTLDPAAPEFASHPAAAAASAFLEAWRHGRWELIAASAFG